MMVPSTPAAALISPTSGKLDLQAMNKGHLPPGRPPWFDINLQISEDASDEDLKTTKSEAMIIGIAGGSASGKTSVSEMIIRDLDVPWVVLISMDSFYKVLGPQDIEKAHRNEYNFDHPDAFDYNMLWDTLNKLRSGQNTKIPIYDFKTHSRLSKSRQVYGANIVIFEGIFALYDKRIRDLMDLKIFVHTDDDIRLARRLRRDIAERGRDLEGVLEQYTKFVKPSFDDYIRPTMRYADVIIPRGADNVVAIELITKHIARQLDERGFSVRSRLADIAKRHKEGPKLPETVIEMEMTPQIKFIQTMMRNKNTCREDLRFFSERLSRLVVERALSELHFKEKKIMTPIGCEYTGLERTSSICGVSIIRAALAMEKPLRKVCPNVTIGKLLIQNSPITNEPHLHFCSLPDDVASKTILLMDATLGTGASMLMAIQVLLEHGVQEDKIILLCLIGSAIGLSIITKCFPKIKIVVGEVDYNLDMDNYYLIPGVGSFGNRYFGTE